MTANRWTPLALLSTALLVLLLVPAGSVVSDGLQQVVVTNFPAVQTVDGNVSVAEPIPLSELIAVEQILVPPVRRSETTRWVSAGTLNAEGFTHAVLSLHGQVKGSVARAGAVGAVLLPKRETIREAFDEFGLIHFSLDVESARIDAKTAYFASGQPRHVVGFPEYEILFYNSTDKTVTVDLFAYLTN